MRMLQLCHVFLVAVLACGAAVGCGETPCEDDLECTVLCRCAEGDTTVGPYACVAGRCGSAYDQDKDCVAPCERIGGVPAAGDDDSAR